MAHTTISVSRLDGSRTGLTEAEVAKLRSGVHGTVVLGAMRSTTTRGEYGTATSTAVRR